MLRTAQAVCTRSFDLSVDLLHRHWCNTRISDSPGYR
jgi:hypothetical protein